MGCLINVIPRETGESRQHILGRDSLHSQGMTDPGPFPHSLRLHVAAKVKYAKKWGSSGDFKKLHVKIKVKYECSDD